MVDVHCHLDLYPNPIEIANEAERLGIYTIGVTNLPSHFIQGMNHIKAYRKIRLAIGMHPLHAARHKAEFPLFQRYLDHTSYIGEIGLDFTKEGAATWQLQVESFEFVLKQLQKKKKVLSLHSRGAELEVLDHLQKFNIQHAIFHWYSGPLDLIEEIAGKGYFFSVNTAMINSKRGQAIINKIPLENLLTESDGPFIEFKGRPVRPPDIKNVEEYISKEFEKSAAFIRQKILQNFFRLIYSIST